MECLYCLFYLAALGFGSFLLGRILPKGWFDYNAFPYRSFSWEDSGRIYLKLRIRQWQNKVPDMSRILPGILPTKQLTHAVPLPVMLRETCVAEFIHIFLSIMGFLCMKIWKGKGGLLLSLLYLLGNLPFILIQRYNRPRLSHLLHQQEKRKVSLELCES